MSDEHDRRAEAGIGGSAEWWRDRIRQIRVQHDVDIANAVAAAVERGRADGVREERARVQREALPLIAGLVRSPCVMGLRKGDDRDLLERDDVVGLAMRLRDIVDGKPVASAPAASAEVCPRCFGGGRIGVGDMLSVGVCFTDDCPDCGGTGRRPA